uniref:MADF domain-containing protein n=1 Tax=Glossina brevipalpis TaxID=37001 RepID=A0A1A9WRV3_9MUSC
MAITANKKFWTEFINLYENLPCLWNNKHEDYSNRDKRIESWDKMVEKLKDVEPDANHDAVKRKINTFRSNFNREVRKIRQSRCNTMEEYNPTLWYFEQLSFLLKQDKYTDKLDFPSDETNMTACDDDTKLTLVASYPTKCEIEALENNTQSNYDNESCRQDDERIKRFLGRRLCRKSPLTKTADNSRNFEQEQKHLWTPDDMVRISSPFGFEEQNKRYPTSVVPSTFNGIIRKYQSRYPKILPDQTQDKDHHNCDLIQEENNEISSQIVQEDTLKRSLDPLGSSVNQFEKQPKFQRFSSSPHHPAACHENRVNTCKSECIDNDEADIYARAWACSYRKLSSEQKLYAKKAMDEILVMGQLNALKLHTVMIHPAAMFSGDGGTGGTIAGCSE